MIKLPQTYLDQARSIFADIDALLGQARHVLDPVETASPFRGDRPEVPPVTYQVLRDRALQLRETMAQMLRVSGTPVQCFHASHVEASRLLIEHAIARAEGLSPDSCDLSEKLSEPAQQDARRWASVILGALRDMAAQLDRPQPADRVTAQEGACQVVGAEDAGHVAACLQDIAQRHRLAHVQRQLALLARRRRTGELRVAVVGRCSVGKSSLINHLLAQPILPVGPLPTTCIPVYLRYGPRTRGEVSFAEAAGEQLEPERLAEFASARANAGNRRHVLSVTMEVNSPALERDVTWIDMPPLADDPAALASFDFLEELLACQVAVLAASAIVPVWEVEAQLIERLCQAGVRVLVVLTKADLLDHDRTLVHEHCLTTLWESTGVRAPVGLVSVKGRASAWCDAWRDTVLRQAIEAARAGKREADASALLALRMATRAELERRARVLQCLHEAPASVANAAAAELIEQAQQRAPEVERLTDELIRQTVRSTAHNAAGLGAAGGSDLLDLSDMLSSTANALISSEAAHQWKGLLVLRAHISLLLARSAEDAWRWPQDPESLPVPIMAHRFDCRGTLPATVLPRPAMADLGRWLADHAIAKRLFAHGAIDSLRDQLLDYLTQLDTWRSRYLDALSMALHPGRDALPYGQVQYRQALAAQLAEDLRLLGPSLEARDA
ncbi:dynamin family protein [Cupriavidus sp. TMH.W2]|uniref:dynamin family protein n=1 Tax=Cupriavidus sp. TMH.W2 TaxID=3434465 RepID=UPI003D789BA7